MKKKLSSLMDSYPRPSDQPASTSTLCSFIYLNGFYCSQFRRLNRRLFFWENVFGSPQKPWLRTEKTEGASSAIIRVGLRNTAKSSVVPT